uniref:Uncharacterized protein n=1 Tax=Cacopsylla melanoneura TaxID=428564 RepID=A0A8D9F4R8_9HEMI
MNASPFTTCSPTSPPAKRTTPATPIQYLRRHLISPLPKSPIRQIVPPQPIDPPTKPLAEQATPAMPVQLRTKPRLTSFIAQSSTQARPSRHRSRTPPRRHSRTPSRHRSRTSLLGQRVVYSSE